MKYGASTYIWTSPFSNQSLELVKKVKDLGFDLIEVCVEQPRTIDPIAIKDEAQKAGIDVLICGAFGPERDISAEDVMIRKTGMEYIKQCIDIACKLKSPLVSGPMYSATGKCRLLGSAEREQQWKWAVENLKVLADYAGERNVRLAIEPLNRFETDFLNTVEQGMELLYQIGSENAGLLLDTFHMNIEEVNISLEIRRAGKKMFHFHACSNTRGIPGEDHIDWNAIKLAFQEIGYIGPAVIEAFTPEITEIARAVSAWRKLASSQDVLAKHGIAFLKAALE